MDSETSTLPPPISRHFGWVSFWRHFGWAGFWRHFRPDEGCWWMGKSFTGDGPLWSVFVTVFLPRWKDLMEGISRGAMTRKNFLIFNGGKNFFFFAWRKWFFFARGKFFFSLEENDFFRSRKIDFFPLRKTDFFRSKKIDFFRSRKWFFFDFFLVKRKKRWSFLFYSFFSFLFAREKSIDWNNDLRGRQSVFSFFLVIFEVHAGHVSSLYDKFWADSVTFFPAHDFGAKKINNVIFLVNSLHASILSLTLNSTNQANA